MDFSNDTEARVAFCRFIKSPLPSTETNEDEYMPKIRHFVNVYRNFVLIFPEYFKLHHEDLIPPVWNFDNSHILALMKLPGKE